MCYWRTMKRALPLFITPSSNIVNIVDLWRVIIHVRVTVHWNDQMFPEWLNFPGCKQALVCISAYFHCKHCLQNCNFQSSSSAPGFIFVFDPKQPKVLAKIWSPAGWTSVFLFLPDLCKIAWNKMANCLNLLILVASASYFLDSVVSKKLITMLWLSSLSKNKSNCKFLC